jgi:uncharacterized membrane protein YhaH (DUF805 family)
MLQVLFGFQGRLRRSAYWGYGVVLTIVAIASSAALAVVAANRGVQWPITKAELPYVAAAAVLTAFFAWIRLALQTKRWHDRGRSGWWSLAVLVPVLGAIWVFVECGFFDGTKGPNRYGPSPKGHLGPEGPLTL